VSNSGSQSHHNFSDVQQFHADRLKSLLIRTFLDPAWFPSTEQVAVEGTVDNGLDTMDFPPLQFCGGALATRCEVMCSNFAIFYVVIAQFWLFLYFGCCAGCMLTGGGAGIARARTIMRVL
jgi:hypothetical protein